MPIPLGSQGQADFTQPIALLMDCHRRIEHFLGVLGRVVERYAQRPLDPPARAALETALTYFRQAAPRHTADEEQSLFPRLRRVNNNPQAHAALAALDRLEADHRNAEAAHARIDALGRRWLADGHLDTAAHTEVQALLRTMTAAYAQHIRAEDEGVFVLAAQALDAAALAAVGREMKQRRSDDPGRPGSRCAQRRAQEFVTQPAAAEPR